MKILAIDPSISNMGWALLTTTPCTRLKASGLAKTRAPRKVARKVRKKSWILRMCQQTDFVAALARRYDPDVVVIEMPITQFKKAARNTNSILKLALLAGRLQGRLESEYTVFMVPPIEWKGQTPKEVTQRRVLRKFPTVSPDTNHNIMDAIGIGLWYARRNA